MLKLLIMILAFSISGPFSTAYAATNPFYTRSYAVVVGIDQYQLDHWHPLGYAVKDAKGVAKLLSEKGLEVIELYDDRATRQQILTALQGKIAPKLGKNDRVVFFLAGHGYTRKAGRQRLGLCCAVRWRRSG